MKRQYTLIGIMLSFTVLFGSFLPVQAQKHTINQPNSNLENAIRNAILKEFTLSDWHDDVEYNFTEVDLNGDGTKEILVGIVHGFPCNNRHCPVYIFKRVKGTYQFVSFVFTLRGSLEVAVLPSRSHGWLDIAAPVFTYQPRETSWKVFKFDGTGYQFTEKKLNFTPKRIVLQENLGPEFENLGPKFHLSPPDLEGVSD